MFSVLDVIKIAGGFVTGYVTGRKQSGKQTASRKVRVGSKPKATPSATPPVFVPREELKMVLCVNTGLKMGTGKIGAQCAHAAVGVLQRYGSSPQHQPAFKHWERYGQPKIALKVQDEQEMDALAAQAQALGMPVYIVHDAGRTQIAAGSQTVLAIGPAPKSQLDTVTGHLKLL